MNEQDSTAAEATTEEDAHVRVQRRFFDVGFWTVTGGVALAVIVPFLVDLAGAWAFWMRVNEMSMTPYWLYG